MRWVFESIYFVGSVMSRLINAGLYRGSVYQTLSARAHIEARNDAAWEPLERRIDRLARLLGETRHCADAWSDEVRRARRTLEREDASREPDFLRF